MTFAIWLREAADSLRRRFAQSRRATHAVARLQKHLNGIVAHRLGHDVNPSTNGEHWLLNLIAPECSTFIDVGANVGEWSSAFCERAPAAHGILIEPSLDAARALRETVLAQRGSSLELLCAAAGAETGTATFYEEPTAGRTSSLHAQASHANAQPRTVDIVTVDSLVEDRGWATLDFLKIDAEGHDYQVLLGARRALRAQKIGVVQFEYNRAWMYAGSSIRSAEEMLASYGYRFFILKGPKLHRFPYERYGDFYHYSNFVGINERLAKRLKHLKIEEI